MADADTEKRLEQIVRARVRANKPQIDHSKKIRQIAAGNPLGAETKTRAQGRENRHQGWAACSRRRSDVINDCPHRGRDREQVCGYAGGYAGRRTFRGRTGGAPRAHDRFRRRGVSGTRAACCQRGGPGDFSRGPLGRHRLPGWRRPVHNQQSRHQDRSGGGRDAGGIRLRIRNHRRPNARSRCSNSIRDDASSSIRSSSWISP